MTNVRDLTPALSLAVQAQMFAGNQMRQDIEQWLSPVDPFINFNTANEAHYEGTAEWFTQSSVFKSWKDSGSLLWIHGKRISSSLSAQPPLLTELYVHSGIREICP
jgi:hypothetical protein